MMEDESSPRCDNAAHDYGLAAEDEAGERRTFISPQDFYREIVQREDVCRVLEALTN